MATDKDEQTLQLLVETNVGAPLEQKHRLDLKKPICPIWEERRVHAWALVIAYMRVVDWSI